MPSQISGTSLYQIANTDCVGDSLPYINANTVTLNNSIVALNNSLTSKFTSSGSVLQVVASSQSLGVKNAPATAQDIGLTPLSVTRKTTTSKFLLELTGGRYSVSSGAQGFSTWFAVSENGGAYINATNNGTTFNASDCVEFVYSANAGQQGPHYAKILYTPTNSSVTTVSLIIYAINYNAGVGTGIWNQNNVAAAPLVTLTMTEIA